MVAEIPAYATFENSECRIEEEQKSNCSRAAIECRSRDSGLAEMFWSWVLRTPLQTAVHNKPNANNFMRPW